MKANIIQIGNSQGVRIPKILLEQLKFEKSVELEVTPEGLLLRPAAEQSNSRAGWAEQFAAALAENDAADDAAEFTDWNASALTSFDENEW
jgi:antitoxin MazE